MKKSDFGIGQVVYLEYVGSQRNRKSNSPDIVETKVTKLGNKYVTTENGYQFHVADGREVTNYAKTYQLHSTKESIELKLELDELEKLVKDFFSFYSHTGRGVEKLTKEEVATIKQILVEAKER